MSYVPTNKITRAPTNWIAAIGRLHPAVTRPNNRASRRPSWYLLQCEASQLEAEMSDEENENNTNIDPIEDDDPSFDGLCNKHNLSNLIVRYPF